jgi:nucleolar GTP-binding protein
LQLEDTEAISFLEVLPQYQAKIQAIHKAIEQGNLRAVKLLTDRKKLALCRDSRGLVPLHKAIVFGQTEIAKVMTGEGRGEGPFGHWE